MRTTKILSISLQPAMLRAAEQAARKEGRSKSELFREALRRYLEEKEWRELRHYGAERAGRRGLKESNVDRLIHERRARRA